MQAPIDEPGASELIDFRASDLWGYPNVVIAIASDPTAMKQALNKRAHFIYRSLLLPS